MGAGRGRRARARVAFGGGIARVWPGVIALLPRFSSRSRDRWALLITALAPVVPQLLGSAFNIWYNVAVVDPLLAGAALKRRFIATVIIYNCLVYPLGIGLWLRLVYALGPAVRRLRAGEVVAPETLGRLRRRVINLPWWGAMISGAAWLFCIPVFLLSLGQVNASLDPRLFWHLPISFGVSAFISVTHSFFLIELASQWGLFPVLFRDTRADLTPGAVALSLRWRGVMWAVSAGICPIGSLLLLSFAPAAPGSDSQWFAMFVGSVGIAFGLCTAMLIGRLVVEPIDHLRAVAQAVGQGRFDVSVPLVRADEFGLLIGEFNHMVVELREKERLRQTFGLHVGRQAAEQILARDPGLGGVEEIITVMFVDIRAFTSRNAAESPGETVRVLNEFLRVMVQVVENQHGGMINKYLGDGFMALFGVNGAEQHADCAVAAGREMLRALPGLNRELGLEGGKALAIGIGIHTGPAVIGSIGSPQRLEFTAIGATVNTASRIEGLTKQLREPLLFTAATRAHLRSEMPVIAHPPQPVRGMEEAVQVFSISEPPAVQMA